MIYSVAIPQDVIESSRLEFRRSNSGRPRKTPDKNVHEWMVLLGLSPWSSWPKCDVCGNTPAYMRKHGLTHSHVVKTYGRYAAHERCYEENREELLTLSLPRLDYQLVVSVTESNAATMLLGRMAVRLSKINEENL